MNEMNGYWVQVLIVQVFACFLLTAAQAQSEASSKGRLHVVAVGINSYKADDLKLKYAVSDAQAIANAFRLQGSSVFGKVLVTLLLDADVTEPRLSRVFTRLARDVRPDDTFLFFAAGHGYTHLEKFYFIPQDFVYQSDNSYGDQAIGADQWQAWFAALKTHRRIVIFDACESGALLPSLEAMLKATKTTYIAAAEAKKFAFEGYRGHGALTFALLDGLANAHNTKGEILAFEFIDHADLLLRKISRQTWGAEQFSAIAITDSNFILARKRP